MSFTAWEPRFLWFNMLWNLTHKTCVCPAYLSSQEQQGHLHSKLSEYSSCSRWQRKQRSIVISTSPCHPNATTRTSSSTQYSWSSLNSQKSAVRWVIYCQFMAAQTDGEMGREYSMILILRARSSFPRTGTNCETGKAPILLRLILLAVLQPEEFCYPAGLVAASHFSSVSKLCLNISLHCCDSTAVLKRKPVR